MKFKRNAAGMPVFGADGRPEVEEWDGSSITFGPEGLSFDEAKKSREFGGNGNEVVLGKNASLRREDLQFIEPGIMEPHLAALNSRDLIGHIEPVDPATEQVSYDKWDHMAAAEIVGPKGRRPRDEISITRTSVTMLEISKGWSLSRRELLGKTTPIQSINAASALQQCQELENSVILDSADYPNADGLIDDAGQTDAATSAWSNAPTTGDPDDDIHDIIGELRAQGFTGGYKCGMEAVNYTEAESREVKAGGSAESYLTHINKRLVAPALLLGGATHGTIVTVDQTPGVAAVLRAEEYKVRIFEMDSEHRINGDVTGVVSIKVSNANGVGTTTGA